MPWQLTPVMGWGGPTRIWLTPVAEMLLARVAVPLVWNWHWLSAL
jgi:hypothetical protein